MTRFSVFYTVTGQLSCGAAPDSGIIRGMNNNKDASGPLFRILSALLALAALAGVFLNTLVVYRGAPEGQEFLHTLNILAYFTILSNLAIAGVYGTAALKPHRVSEGLRGGVTLYIMITGIIFFLLLRGLVENPTRLFAVGNILVHYAAPLGGVLLWFGFPPRRRLSLGRTIPRWLVFPFIYSLLTLIKGSLTDWYPYPFADVGTRGLGPVLITFAVLLVIFTLMGSLLILVRDKLLYRKGLSGK